MPSNNTYTSAVAKLKRCPTVQILIIGNLAIVTNTGKRLKRDDLREDGVQVQNTGTTTPDHVVELTRCIAEECMWWRWDDPMNTEGSCSAIIKI